MGCLKLYQSNEVNKNVGLKIAHINTDNQLNNHQYANHLSNVLAVVSDRRTPHQNGIHIDYYEADVTKATLYYPFGMEMKTYQADSNGYRYGFGGLERADEVAGSGNSYTAEYWQYYARLGRRFNVDPMSGKYAWQSTYACFNNNPIYFNDPKGLEGTSDDPKNNSTHRVKKDDTGYGIAAKYDNVTFALLKKWNPTVNWSALQINSEIIISEPKKVVKEKTLAESGITIQENSNSSTYSINDEVMSGSPPQEGPYKNRRLDDRSAENIIFERRNKFFELFGCVCFGAQGSKTTINNAILERRFEYDCSQNYFPSKRNVRVNIFKVKQGLTQVFITSRTSRYHLRLE